MRFLLLAAVMLATSAAAPLQDTGVSSTGGSLKSPSLAGAEPELPVSLERIRGMLLQPAPLQQTLLKRPTFKVEVEERRQIQDLIATLDFKSKSSPAPPGGLYAYETQRVMLSSLSSPMMQPYAAFSGGELLTLAFEAILAKYLGRLAIDAITAADRARAENAARAEVSRAILEYCAALPGKGAGVRICTEPPTP